MSADLWTPEQIDAERDELVERTLAEHVREGAALERELRKLDPYLRVGFVSERAPALPGLIPGRWHVIRKNPDAIDTYLPIAGPDGEYREPSFQIIEEMKARDLWVAGAMEKLAKRRQAEIDRREAEDSRKREQAKDEAREVWRAAKRVPGEGGMTRRRWAKGLVG